MLEQAMIQLSHQQNLAKNEIRLFPKHCDDGDDVALVQVLVVDLYEQQVLYVLLDDGMVQQHM